MLLRASTAVRMLLVLLGVTLFFVGPARGTDIPLTVTNDLSIARESYPMSVGIPFAQGELANASALSVSGPQGRVAQWQATPLSHWWDGSVRWALVDFPVDVAARSTASYTVSDDGATSTSALTVSRSGNLVTVRTGVIEFTVDTTSLRVVESLAVDTDGDGTYERGVIAAGTSAGLVVTATGGAEYSAHVDAPTRFEIEEQGPQRVTLAFEGELTRADAGLPLMKYVLRLSAFAGRGDLRAQVTLLNPKKGSTDFGGVGATYFEDARIELSTNLGGAALRAGSDDAASPVNYSLGSGHFYLHQDSSGHPENWNLHAQRRQQTYRGWRAFGGVEGTEVQLTGGDRSHGWLETNAGDVTAAVGIAEFWQNYPNAIDAWGDGRIAARFFSRYQSGDFELRGGEQKTHVVHFRFAPAGARDAAYEMPTVMDRIIGLAPPQRYADSGSFKRFLTRERSHQIPTVTGDWERMQLATVEGGQGWRGAFNAFRNRVDDDVNSWLDWGDFFAEYENRGDRSNGENDFGYGSTLQMIRSGDARWWRLLDPLARHQADIDVYHAEFEDLYYEFRLGGFWEHDRGGSNRHRGKFPETNHYNAQGMFAYYYLTGDRVVIDSAMKVAENAKYRTDRGAEGDYDYGFSFIGSETEMRAPAWLLNIVTEGWKYTRDPSWATTALNIIDRTQPETRCWYDTVPCNYPYNNKPFVDTWQMAMLMTSVGDFLDERARETGVRDPQGMRLLDLWGGWLQANAWMPEHRLFGNQWYADTGVIQPDWSGGNILRIIDALTHAYNATGNAAHLAHLDTAFATATANPWYQDSGVTYGDVKIAATLARNGHAYMEFVGRNVDPGAGGCLPRPTSNPAPGVPYDSASPLLLFFSRQVADGALEANLTVTGSQTGSFQPAVTTTDGLAFSLSFTPVPQVGETITLVLGPGTSATDGSVLDGNGDGSCGDPYLLNLTVGERTVEPDRVPPATVIDLSMTYDPQSGAALVMWTAPSDDGGATGQPIALDIRHQILAPGEAFDWDLATRTTGVGAPSEPGQSQLADLGVIDAQRGALSVAMRTVDAAGNHSEISNVVVDPTGPVAVFAAGASVQKAPGARHLLSVHASDELTGRGLVTAVRCWREGDDPATAAIVDLVPEEDAAYRGTAFVEIDGASWMEGEQYDYRLAARDAAGNWSVAPASIAVLATGQVPVDGCLAVDSLIPAPGQDLPHLSTVQIGFTMPLDVASVDDQAFRVIGADGSPEDFAWKWAIPGRVVQLLFKPPLDQRGDVTLELSSSLKAVGGVAFGEGASCATTSSFVFPLRPELDSEAFAGTALDAHDEHGRIAVDGFELILTGLEPGGTLRVYDAAGRLLLESDVVDGQIRFDARDLGRFPARLLILAYKGHQQKVVVGGDQPYLSYLD